MAARQCQPPANATPGDRGQLKAHVSWLVCKEVCIPEDTTVTLPLAVAAAPRAARPGGRSQLCRGKRTHCPSVRPGPRASEAPRLLDLMLAEPKLANANVTAVHFFPFAQGEVKGIAAQQWTVSQAGLLFDLRLEKTRTSLAYTRRRRGDRERAAHRHRRWKFLHNPVPFRISAALREMNLALALVFASSAASSSTSCPACCRSWR